MKRLHLTLAFLALAAVASATSGEELKEEDDKIEAECAAEWNVDVAEADKALSDNENLTEPIKCYAKCTMQALGVVDADGKIDDDVLMQKFEVDDMPVHKNIIQTLLNDCKNTVPADGSCGYGYDIIQCILQSAKDLCGDSFSKCTE